MEAVQRTALSLGIVWLTLALGATSQAATIVGFEDSAILARVLGGEIVTQEGAPSDLELHLTSRAYFEKVTAEQYLALLTDYANYPDVIPEARKGQTTSVNASKTLYTYALDMIFKVGFISQKVHLEGKQALTLPTALDNETKILHEVTNQKTQITSAVQKTRLIPYEKGILILDQADVVLHSKVKYRSIIKGEMKKFFVRWLPRFRTGLEP